MKVELIDFTVRELVEGYDGVVGNGGKLDRFYVRGDRKYARVVVRRKGDGR